MDRCMDWNRTGRFEINGGFAGQPRRKNGMPPNEEVSNSAMECDSCFLPFRMIEQRLSPSVPERLVECRCPECGHLVANVATKHELVVASIH